MKNFRRIKKPIIHSASKAQGLKSTKTKPAPHHLIKSRTKRGPTFTRKRPHLYPGRSACCRGGGTELSNVSQPSSTCHVALVWGVRQISSRGAEIMETKETEELKCFQKLTVLKHLTRTKAEQHNQQSPGQSLIITVGKGKSHKHTFKHNQL